MPVVLLSMRLRGAETQMNNTNIVGKTVSETQDAKLWQRDHELSVALAYVEIRMNLSKRSRPPRSEIIAADPTSAVANCCTQSRV
jgi:hypothetical protein